MLDIRRGKTRRKKEINDSFLKTDLPYVLEKEKNVGFYIEKTMRVSDGVLYKV